MALLTKLYGTFCVGMGTYGFTRGYRAYSGTEDTNLTCDKVLQGVINGMAYGAPILNMWPTFRLLNRLEIECRSLNKDNYQSNYEEFIGVCKETI
jgi:hypothetical protein